MKQVIDKVNIKRKIRQNNTRSLKPMQIFFCISSILAYSIILFIEPSILAFLIATIAIGTYTIPFYFFMPSSYRAANPFTWKTRIGLEDEYKPKIIKKDEYNNAIAYIKKYKVNPESNLFWKVLFVSNLIDINDYFNKNVNVNINDVNLYLRVMREEEANRHIFKGTKYSHNDSRVSGVSIEELLYDQHLWEIVDAQKQKLYEGHKTMANQEKQITKPKSEINEFWSHSSYLFIGFMSILTMLFSSIIVIYYSITGSTLSTIQLIISLSCLITVSLIISLSLGISWLIRIKKINGLTHQIKNTMNENVYEKDDNLKLFLYKSNLIDTFQFLSDDYNTETTNENNLYSRKITLHKGPYQIVKWTLNSHSIKRHHNKYHVHGSICNYRELIDLSNKIDKSNSNQNNN